MEGRDYSKRLPPGEPPPLKTKCRRRPRPFENPVAARPTVEPVVLPRRPARKDESLPAPAEKNVPLPWPPN